MAEFATRRMEEKVPYLELLQLTQLFTSEDIKEIVQDFSNHEYKIQRKRRTLDDYLRYIDAQMKLIARIHERREETNYYHKTQQIEDVIKTHISCLFGVAGQRYHNRLDFWSARINFAKSQKWSTAVRKHFEEVTKKLGGKFPQLWIEASNYEWSLHPSNIDAARRILQLGIRGNSDCESLYIAAFRLELEYVNYLEGNPSQLDKILSEDSGDLIVNKLALAKLIYNSARDKCKKSDQFFLKFFLALSDVNPVKTQELLEQIRADGESDFKIRSEAKSKLTNTSTDDEEDEEEVQNRVLMQFQNFPLFFSSLHEVIDGLKKVESVTNLRFWTTIFHALHLKHLQLPIKINDWFQLCSVPKSSAVVIHLRLWVLDFYSLNYPSGSTKALKWYNKIHSVFPTSPEIHLRMAEIEKGRGTLNLDSVRQCFDRALQLHGREYIQPWLEYIQFEKRYSPRQTKHSMIYARALRELNPALVESFKITVLKEQT